MRTYRFMFPVLLAMTATGSLTAGPSDKGSSGIRFPEVNQVKIEDTFWKPKLNLWQKVTVNDVFDKFEGKHLEHPGEFCNTFENFDRVAKGERNIGRHAGAPWFDGLVYETIRGVADLMARQSDAALEKRVDGYIDRIAVAQASEPNGYIDTYTQLMEADHQWESGEECSVGNTMYTTPVCWWKRAYTIIMRPEKQNYWKWQLAVLI